MLPESLEFYNNNTLFTLRRNREVCSIEYKKFHDNRVSLDWHSPTITTVEIPEVIYDIIYSAFEGGKKQKAKEIREILNIRE